MPGVAAIASERRGRGLRPRVAARPASRTTTDNTTRFLLIGRVARSATAAANKTTIVFTLPNTPGALFKALSVFALREIDVTKLESRPTGRPWEYLFHLDLAVGRAGAPCARALVHLAEFAPSLKMLGSYPGWRRRRAPAVRGRRAVAGGFRRPRSKHKRAPLTDGPEPRPGARHAEGRRLLPTPTCRSRSSASPTPGPRSVPCNFHLRELAAHGEGGHPRGRRHADGVQHRLHLRRHHDGHRGHEGLARQPRGHRRLDRAGRPRQHLRRVVVPGRLRQDDPRRASWRWRG